MIRLLLFMHHNALHLMHCVILLLAHICSCTLDHVESGFEEPTEQAQVEDFTNLVLDQGKPQCINQCSLSLILNISLCFTLIVQ
jgi:hypothetical protein